MSSFNLKYQIYTYLGFKGVEADAQTDSLICECLRELEKTVHFRALHRIFDKPPAFAQKEPYASFLFSCTAAIVSVTTLGAETDKYIRYLERADMTKAVVADATASAYLEQLSDNYERTLGDNLTYRFCPGYGGSKVDDLREVFALLRAEKIGVSLTDSCYMLPHKSMAGIIGVGKSVQKSCKDCFMLGKCAYLKEGTKCYDSENK